MASRTNRDEPELLPVTAADAGNGVEAGQAAAGADVAAERKISQRVETERDGPGQENDDQERVSINIDLPEQVHSAPADEAAVAIDDVAIDPVSVDPESLLTRSVAIVSPAVVDPAGEEAPVGSETETESVYSRRDRLRGEPSTTPEPAAMLTAERLLGTGRAQRQRPEGRWSSLVYSASFGMVNLGDSAAVRASKLIDLRIHKQFDGGTRFVPILTRKGGVGKTTVTTLLGMALASVREDRVIAIDANPDRGTLAERVSKQTRSTVRDVVTRAASVTTFSDFSSLVSRDDTRLDILASDTDPLLSEAFDEDDYNVVADLCARFYSIALTDCGTGIVHSVMRATLQRADSVVIVSGGSVDEARLASETLTWLEANGYSELVRNAVVALNTGTQGTNLVKLEEIEAHFRSRVREIVRIPYDPQLAAGSVINYSRLKPLTRAAARQLAALVVDGLPTGRSL
ncbi:MAG: MinD/ParA family protein [Microbacteriaceae bacterium]|nr:MinD/ParA family protein [Microbacteriaceae bacterium]